MTTLQAIILAIIEGLTEFLPISSTGHMVVASSLFGIADDDFTKLFTVAIQFGAILSVVALYWRKFFDFSRLQFYVKLLIAVIPALIFGKLLGEHIDAMLEKPLPIGVIFLLGGIMFLFIDDWFKKPTIKSEEDITTLHALKIGLFQVLAILFPGLSRSAATIIGGLTQKLSREVAAEFSFLLAVPTMAAATLYKVFLDGITHNGVEMKGYELMLSDKAMLINFLIGNVIAFVVAYVAIKTFISYVSKHGFRVFGYYRIAAGVVVIVLSLAGLI